MKRIITVLSTFIIVLTSCFAAYATEGNVIYDGYAKAFIFEPGSEYSPTDLFKDFKGVMPGDILTQKITVKNNADKNVKVKIYLRSLGAHEDSAEFLSQLSLKVKKSEDNEMAYMFDAFSNERAQLDNWVCLGTLYSGGEVNLDVELSVPVELDNQFQNKTGYLDWEFMVEEFPIEDTDPKPPQTGDAFNTYLWISILGICALALIILIFLKNKKEK